MQNGNSLIHVVKTHGKIRNLEELLTKQPLKGETAVGHTRWATHGEVTPVNAHPHFDCKREIAVVHNGIIENYQELRTRLEHNHLFVSQTDTEVIPHLIEEYVDAGASLEEAVLKTTKQLRGSYAIVAVSLKDPGKVVASRKDSPLVVGKNEGKNFVSSDVLAFLEQTNRVAYLEDGETVVLTKDIAFCTCAQTPSDETANPLTTSSCFNEPTKAKFVPGP